MLSKNVIYIIVICAISLFGCRQDNKKKNRLLTQEEIIQIANKERISEGISIEESNVYYDIENKKWKSRLSSLKNTSPEYAKRFSVLDGRDYQAVHYSLKKIAPGGVLWVFVDKSTSEVIAIHGEP